VSESTALRSLEFIRGEGRRCRLGSTPARHKPAYRHIKNRTTSDFPSGPASSRRRSVIYPPFVRMFRSRFSDPNVVHVALSVLSHPALTSMLDERNCNMILLALHQSLEPSIQVVAAKLLTHLATAHRAIVQPLAWSHIRQSLSLMDFLQTVDPTRAIIEACIISNLL